MNTLGQYIPGDSFLHRLDPRTKILFVFVIMTLIFYSSNFKAYGWMFLFILSGYVISKISLIYILKNARQIWLIVFLTAVLHLWLTKKGPIILDYYFITVYEEGVVIASFVALRLILLVLTASLLTFTTSTMDLIDGLERLFQPFARFGFPASEFALMMSITLRFIPVLGEELENLKKAQLARGSKLNQGWIWPRLKYYIPLFIPLFFSIFRRSDELAQAMESRCYRGNQPRTKFRQLCFTKTDGWALGILFIFIVGVLGVQRIEIL